MIGTTILSALLVLGVVLISMVLHELAHGLVAYLLGDQTAKENGRLTLNPIKHLDPVLSVALPLVLLLTGAPVFGGAKPVPVNTRNLKFGAWGMALVAIAGPLMNLILAFIAFLVLYFAMGSMSLSDFWPMIMWRFLTVNLGLAIFNMIPIPPLDGSRILYAIAPSQVQDFMEKFEKVGIMVVMVIVVALPGVTSAVIGGAMSGILNGFYWIVGA